MLKKVNQLGKSLTKEEQKSVNGGLRFPIGCQTRRDCFFVDFAVRCINNRCVFL
ncbi:hypothetical protein [uncultured Tenacibaculum sp.]|uniref:hypothetical protein n=1 Tax=uncultured Tenacibaculum sp. TaxID=174713 RepID=UPI00261D471B|nr:hypothetical protein [uncultured Tenacibaculum sp.]